MRETEHQSHTSLIFIAGEKIKWTFRISLFYICNLSIDHFVPHVIYCTIYMYETQQTTEQPFCAPCPALTEGSSINKRYGPFIPAVSADLTIIIDLQVKGNSLKRVKRGRPTNDPIRQTSVRKIISRHNNQI